MQPVVGSALVMGGALLVAVGLDLSSSIANKSLAFKLRRLANWLSVGANYSCYYFARYSVAITNTEDTRARLGVTEREMGVVLMVGFWSYAAGQVFAGVVVDTVGGKASLLLGSVVCGMMNVGIGMAHLRGAGLGWIGLMFATNMAFNTFGALSTIKVNMAWYNKDERGFFSGLFGSVIALGYWGSLVLGSVVYAMWSLSTVFFAAACSLAASSLVVVLVVSNQPRAEATGHRKGRTVSVSSVGSGEQAAGAGEQGNLDQAPEDDTEQLVDATTPSSSSSSSRNNSNNNNTLGTSKAAPSGLSLTTRLRAVLSNPRVLWGCGIMFWTGWVREGFVSWLASYMESTHGVAAGTPVFVLVATTVALGGVLGSLVAGWVSDRVFGSDRSAVALMLFTLQAVVLLLLAIPGLSLGWVVPLIGLLAVGVLGVLSLLMGTISADAVAPHLQGSANGVLNATQYVGSGTGSAVIGTCLSAFGWGVWTWTILPGSLFAALLVVRMRSGRKQTTKRVLVGVVQKTDRVSS